MRIRFRDPREPALISTEIRQFFIHRRNMHFLPLVVGGIFLVQWPYWGSPLAVVILVTVAGLEPQFNNILFRTPSEVESLSVLPLSWDKVVRAKNIATILLLLLMLPVVAMVLLYFPAIPVTIDDTVSAVWYLATVIFPLVHIGNIRSVSNPRRDTGWRLDDVTGMIELVITLGVLSLPFVIFVLLLKMPVLCLAYSVFTALFWWRYSVNRTAREIRMRRIDICLNV